MPPPTPEHRFEVPPEYAEVYERAYRRAYEEGQGQLSGGAEAEPVRRARGRRVARTPGPRTSHRAVGHARSSPWAPTWPGDRHEEVTPEAGPEGSAETAAVEDAGVAPASGPGAGDAAPLIVHHHHHVATRSRRRAKRRRASASTAASLLGVLVVTALLLAAAFLAGRWSVDQLSGATRNPADAPSGARTSAAAAPPSPARAVVSGLAGLQAALEPPGRYRGAVRTAEISSATATCTAPADRDAAGRRVSYVAGNTLDGLPRTAWLCQGGAVGERLTLHLPVPTDVVGVGLVPGYAKSDRYPQNNRVTRVVWVFDDGTRMVQSMGGSPTDRSLRVLRIDPVRTRTVVLEVRRVVKGPNDNTAISTVLLDTYRSSAG